MEEILNKAHELGELIAGSRELAEYQAQEMAFAADAEAQKALSVYEEKSAALAEEMRSGAMTPERLQGFRDRMNGMMAELTENPAFNRIITQINEILGYHINGGEEAGGCGGNCSGCSGCH